MASIQGHAVFDESAGIANPRAAIDPSDFSSKH